MAQQRQQHRIWHKFIENIWNGESVRLISKAESWLDSFGRHWFNFLSLVPFLFWFVVFRVHFFQLRFNLALCEFVLVFIWPLNLTKKYGFQSESQQEVKMKNKKNEKIERNHVQTSTFASCIRRFYFSIGFFSWFAPLHTHTHTHAEHRN